MSDNSKIAVLGGGSFGTTIANIAAENGCQVRLWMRSEEAVKNLQSTRVNAKYLPGLKLHDNLTACAQLEQAVAGANIIFFAIPSKSFREVAKSVKDIVKSDQFLMII